MWCSGVRRRRRLSRQAWPNLWKLYDNSSLTLRQTRLAEPHRATGRPEFRRGALKILAITVPHLRNFAYPAKHPAGSQCGDQIQVSPQRICFRLRRPRFRFSRDTSHPPNFDYPSSLPWLLLSQDGPPSGVVTSLVIVSEFIRGSSKESIFGFVIILIAHSCLRRRMCRQDKSTPRWRNFPAA